MKKFLKDLAEVGKDIWYGFVYIVDFVYELGEILASKVSKNKEVVIAKTMPATRRVIENCIEN